MVQKDLKKINLILSTSITTAVEAAINLIPYISYRQILNPLGVMVSIGLSIFITYKIKCFSCNVIIKNNEDEMLELSLNTTTENCAKIVSLKSENSKLKKVKSKLDFF